MWWDLAASETKPHFWINEIIICGSPTHINGFVLIDEKSTRKFGDQRVKYKKFNVRCRRYYRGNINTKDFFY